jgi:hypothetical protein
MAMKPVDDQPVVEEATADPLQAIRRANAGAAIEIRFVDITAHQNIGALWECQI